jgi:hypothetical protein
MKKFITTFSYCRDHAEPDLPVLKVQNGLFFEVSCESLSNPELASRCILQAVHYSGIAIA